LYSYLIIDLSYYPENAPTVKKNYIRFLLEKGKKREKNRKRLLWTGVGICLSGLIIIGTEGGTDRLQGASNLKKIGYGICGVGVAFTSAGVSLENEKNFYRRALAEYNKLFR